MPRPLRPSILLLGAISIGAALVPLLSLRVRTTAPPPAAPLTAQELLSSAFWTATSIVDEKMRELALERVAVARAQTGDVAGAWEAAGLIRSRSREEVWAAIAVQEAAAGHSDEFRRVAGLLGSEMRCVRVLARLPVPELRAEMVPAVVAACRPEDDAQAVSELLSRLARRLARLGQREAAVELFARACRLAWSTRAGSRELAVDAVWKAIDAAGLARECRDCCPKVRPAPPETMKALAVGGGATPPLQRAALGMDRASALYRTGHRAAARRELLGVHRLALAEARKQGNAASSQDWNPLAGGTLADIPAAAQDLEGLRQLAEAVPDPWGWCRSAYSSALLQSGRVDQAARVAAGIGSNDAAVPTLVEVAAALDQRKRHEEARQVLLHARHLALGLEEPIPRSVALNSLAQAQCRGGRVADAFETARRDTGALRDGTLKTVSSCYAHRGDFAMVFTATDEISASFRMGALLEGARIRLSYRDTDGARRLIDRAASAGRAAPEDGWQYLEWCRIAAAQAEISSRSDTLESFRQAKRACEPGHGWDAGDFETVAEFMGATGEERTCRAWIGDLPRPYDRTISLIALATSLYPRQHQHSRRWKGMFPNRWGVSSPPPDGPDEY